MKKLNLKAALLAVTALGAPFAATAAGLDQFIGFGDSTMDNGYFRYNPTGGYPALHLSSAQMTALIDKVVANGGSGGFAGPGVVDTTLLAAKFGLSATPYIVGGGGGTNYANGSAQTVLTTAQDNYAAGIIDNVPIVSQISNYLAMVNGRANPGALYMIDSGANDMLWLEGQTANTPALANADMASWAATLASGVATLQADGARTIVELNIYAYPVLVGPGGTLTATAAADVAEQEAYSAQIWSRLAAAGVNFIPADVEHLLTYVSQHPAKFGLTAGTVLSSSPACGATPAIICTPANLVAPNAEQTYLFADVHHLTTAGQAIEADYIDSLLTAPSQISLLAASAVQSALARAATIQGQIDLSGQQRGPGGFNAWVSAGAYRLNLTTARDFPDASGIPFSGTVGTDYRTPGGVIVGAAVTAGDQTSGFSTGGNFGQVDEALSLYAATKSGPVWGNVVASYGRLEDHVARQVTLGDFTDQNSADTTGQSLALALRAGGDIHFGPVTTGPLAGVVVQQVRLSGFTETGSSGVTALSYGGQTRDSFISQLGWRGSVDWNRWRLFTDVQWNHEWARKDNTVMASLTSIAAPSFLAAAAAVAADWATGSVGASFKLNARVMLRGALSAVLGNPQVGRYGGELGINVGF